MKFTEAPATSQREVLTLCVLTALCVAPHVGRLDLRVSLFFGLVLLLRLLALYWPKLQPSRLPLFLLTLLGGIIIFSLYPLLMGLEAKIALLCLMLGLKLLEVRKRRDLYVVVFLCYFVLITQFLFEQSIPLAGYVFVMALGATATLMDASRMGPAPRPLHSYRASAVLLLQAIPIALVLFFLFPRLGGPLWNLGVDNSTARTGMSDSMSPGSISNLVRSHEVAFRVDFAGPIPPSPLRYWRGVVLWHTDGWRWDKVDYLTTEPVRYQPLSPATEYTITLEPTSNAWLYALDLPETIPAEASATADYQLASQRPVDTRYRYQMRSRLAYNTGPLPERERQLGLQLPGNTTRRMAQLVDSWRAQAESDAGLVRLALNHFRQQPFYYTLQPPRLLSNPVDEFLFETRRGFCENYATSFVTLMRLAGIPARIVTGYQGGEVNPLGDYLIVRQSDAHAWAEVWLPDAGWRRVDPTAAVAPERIERPFDADLAEQSKSGLPISFDVSRIDWMKRVARQFQLGIDAANASWHRWVLGYSHERQRQLLSWLGLDFLWGTKLAIGMAVIVATLLVIIAALIWRRSLTRIDPVQREYLRFCQRLDNCGLTRLPHEGPEDYAQRVLRTRPDLAQPVAEIVQLYIGLRYGRLNDTRLGQRLKRRVRGFRPRPVRS